MSLSGLMEWCLEHLNYWVVFVLMVLENSVVPLPSELIVTPAAYKAANGEMSILLVIFITTLGSTIGAVINYYIALAVGRPLVYRFANSRLGHLLFINRQKIEYVEALFFKAWQDFYLFRQAVTRWKAIYLYSCRIDADEVVLFYSIHVSGVRDME